MSSDKIDIFPSIILGIFSFSAAIIGFFLSVFFSEQLNYTGNQIGLLFSIQAGTGMLAAFPSGYCNDRITSRTLVGITLIMQAIFFVLMGTIQTSFLWFLPIFFILSLSIWIFRLSLDVQFLKTRTQKQIGGRIGFFQAFRFTGATLGTLLGGYFIMKFDFQITLIIVGVICLLLFIPSLFLAPTRISRVSISDYRSDFSNKKVIIFAFWLMLFAMHWGAEQTCYGLFLRKNLHLSFIGMGWYMSSEFLAIIFALIVGSDLIHKGENAGKMAIWGLAASGIGHIGMTCDIVSISLCFRVLHGIGDGFMLLITYYGIAKLFSIEHMGGNTGLIHLATMIGYIIGSLIFSPIGERFGYMHPLWISGMITLFLILPLVSVRIRNLTVPQESTK